MSVNRARRATTKRINYSKEQEFSDEDLFEDDEAPVATTVQADTSTRRRRIRKPKETSAPYHVASSAAIRGLQEDPSSVYSASRLVYTEKGYDPSLPPIRERFTFMPEYEEDGTMKIELIVGRRPLDESIQGKTDLSTDSNEDFARGKLEYDQASLQENDLAHNDKDSRKKPSPMKSSEQLESLHSSVVEYEYLIKYKGRSYLHLEWKTGADLESMNKSAKSLYRRYLKKLAQGTEDDLENPEFDPTYAIPEKILDEAEQEITIELTDKELLRWEKQREKELSLETRADADEELKSPLDEIPQNSKNDNNGNASGGCASSEQKDKEEDDDILTEEESINFASIPISRLRAIVNKEGAYYPTVEGSDNPYRDGYITVPPKKPRASYLFFQCALRSYYQKKNPQANLQSELMATLGDAWRKLSDEEKSPFVQLAAEETKQYELQKELLEKAQKPNAVWQPLRRCEMVLDRISSDQFSEVFLQPVDTNEFTDYKEIIDQPMDLGTLRKRIESKKYQTCEQFARDARKIWNNCKIYNSHGSAIWYVADYMSKQFERIYHAWVLEFRERYIRWADPRARPWEYSCRIHDGKCQTPDEKMVLCDHCDGVYGLACLNPPLTKVPKLAWQCPDCKPRIKSVKGFRMLSAVAENAARKRAELGDLPKKRVSQTMYLVKWIGLGYEFCTWETRKDVANDSLIASFHRISRNNSDEADMKEDTIELFLSQVKHLHTEDAEGIDVVRSLQTQLYAQCRAFQFVKFGDKLPHTIEEQVGAKTLSSSIPVPFRTPRAVVECLTELVERVSKNLDLNGILAASYLPPLMSGEYDAVIPITSKGLMMNVGEVHGSVAFLGYRQFPCGTKGPAESQNLVRNVGDKIIAVDGISTIGMSFKDVISLLRESGKNKYAYMRFLETKYSVCDHSLSSAGTKGRYAFEELQKKFIADRQLLMAQRLTEAEQKDDGLVEDTKLDEDSDIESENGSEGSFLPSEDEALLDVLSENPNLEAQCKPDDRAIVGESLNVSSSVTAAVQSDCVTKPDRLKVQVASPRNTAFAEGLTCRSEMTRSLAFRLIGSDVGYSSDENGDEDYAYFLDGVDGSFQSTCSVEKSIIATNGNFTRNLDTKDVVLPAKKGEFTVHGDRAKLAVAVALSTKRLEISTFNTFSSTTEDNDALNSKETDITTSNSSSKRSTVKVQQVSATTGEVINVWANIEAAAATHGLPLAQLKQVLRGEYDEDEGDEVGGFKWTYAPSGAKVTAGNSTTRSGSGKKAKEAWLQFREKLYDPNEPHIYKNGNRLRDYQVDGVNWLASTWYKRQGCILADEMGLGKTVQIVCYIEHLYRVEKVKRPFLVVVPLSTVGHWRREFEGWTDMICCIYHDRQRVWRDVMREYEWYFEDRPHTPEFLKFDVLVTTYDTLISDFDVISQIPFRVSVVDEAHRLRNQKGKLLECMREVSLRGSKEYGYQSRVLMSGTPLQNDLTELWTLLNFVDPFKFPDLESFQEKFGNMANRSEVEALQKLISPYMLRRVKEDVAKDIPAKEETLIDVELTSIQKKYYRAIFEHNLSFLNMGGMRQNTPKLMNIQMELRKVCNHPFLIDGVEHRENDRLYKEFTEKGQFDGKTPEEQQHLLNEHGYIMTSGKMVLLDKLLPKLRQEGHKILIFSQMVKMLDLISEYCDFRGFRHERLDGRVRGTERQKAIDRFEKEDDSFLFLLSTRAGGVGINLTAADICIIFDSDWNPQNDVQAQARCHRIGQTKDVRIYRLITSRSFEQEMFERASRKLGLEQAILGTFEKDDEDDKPTQQEMEQLLKKGAYALLDDDNDEIIREFCADDIESILAKRTRTRVVEGTKTASWLNKSGLVVSKSKFTSESGENLDLTDPDFWKKVMPNFFTPSILLQKLNGLQDEIEGSSNKGPGRGRGRPKKSLQDGINTNEEPQSLAAITKVANVTEGDSNDENEKRKISRKNLRTVQAFMNDLKNMMENILEENDDDGLKGEEKEICQNLLLKISVKEKMFNDEQRRLAKMFLKRLTGDRRRRCRTSEQQRFKPGADNEEPVHRIREELMIVGKKKVKRKKRNMSLEEELPPQSSRSKRTSDNDGTLVGEDGYLHHSDSEDDWSDVVDDFYLGGSKRKDKISAKEALRRRQWGADDDDAAVAGRAWPVFPRHVVKPVLTHIMAEVIKYDKERGGVFSVPVPRSEFPEYYEQIKQPMDYGTMELKLENGEYRSVQMMQKDFVLMLQNCRQFNAASSEIVTEAREQHLIRPTFLRAAAKKYNLFLAEDGSVLEILEENKATSKETREAAKSKKAKEKDTIEDDKTMHVKRNKKKDKPQIDAAVGTKTKKLKLQLSNGQIPTTSSKNDKSSKDSSEFPSSSTKIPKIRIKVKKRDDIAQDENKDVDSSKGQKGTLATHKRKRNDEELVDDHENDGEIEVGTKRKRKSKVLNEKNDDKKAKGNKPDSKKKIRFIKLSSDDTDSKLHQQNLEDTAKVEKSTATKSSFFTNLSYWKKRREALSGDFAEAKANFTEHGPWKLSDQLPSDVFGEVAERTLERMARHDKFSVFANAVTEKEAPGYKDVIKNPMHFGTMRQKVKLGKYGKGDKATSGFYQDFLLVFENCYLYNSEESEVTEEAARVLGYLPEAFVAACIHAAKSK